MVEQATRHANTARVPIRLVADAEHPRKQTLSVRVAQQPKPAGCMER